MLAYSFTGFVHGHHGGRQAGIAPDPQLYNQQAGWREVCVRGGSGLAQASETLNIAYDSKYYSEIFKLKFINKF